MKNLYVRIDKVNNNVKVTKDDFKAHIEYLEKIANDRYFKGGGFINEPGGMIIFEASNIDEAKEICDNDPIISKGYYKYEIYQWEIIIK